MRDDDFEDNSDHKPAAQTDIKLMSADNAQRQFENLMHGGGLQQALQLRSDADGNARLLGFKVSKEMKAVLGTAIPNVINWLQNVGADFSYEKTLQLFKNKNARAKGIAQAVEYGVRWGLIGAQPIIEGITNAKAYSRQRKQLFDEFAPVVAATRANYKTNEVIRHAFDELHDEMVTNTKALAASALTLAPLVYVGIKAQKVAKEKRLNREGLLDSSINEEMQAIRHGWNHADARQIALEEMQAKARAEYIAAKKDVIKGANGQPLSAEALGKRFDKNAKEFLEQREDDRRAARKEQFAQTRHDETKQRNIGEAGVILSLSLATQIIQANISEAAEKRKKPTNAWRMIKQLKVTMDGESSKRSSKRSNYDDDYDGDSEGRKADQIYVDVAGVKGGRLSLKAFIAEVFQQNERDHSRTPIGPTLMKQLEPAIDQIAEAVAEGRLDALALVNLVGEGKVVIHKGAGLRSFAPENTVEALIDEQMKVLGSRERLKPEEFFSDFADPLLIQNTLKKTIETLKGAEKAVFISLFPNDILEQTGMKRSDIVALRKQAAERYAVISAIILDLARKDPAVLEKELGLSSQAVEAIGKLAEKIESGDKLAIKSIDGRDKTILGAVRTAVLTQHATKKGEGEAYWSNRVKEARTVRHETHDRAEDDDKRHKHLASGDLADRELKRRTPKETDGISAG